MSSGNLEPNEETDKIVTQNSLDAHQVTDGAATTEDKDWKTISPQMSPQASSDVVDVEQGIEKKETTLKDNDPINNDTEEIDLNKIQERIRKQSAHLREIGDQATMREIGVLDEHEKQLSAQRYANTQKNSFLGDDMRQTDSIIQITPTSSFLVRHNNITTILIDEFDAQSDIKEYETIEVSLPRSPMAALILMESIGLWQEMDNITKASIYCAIFLTIIIQYLAAGALYFQKFLAKSENFDDYKGGAQYALFNAVVMSFVVIYLAQDSARLYKMYILLKHVTGGTKTSSLGTQQQQQQQAPPSKAGSNKDIEMGKTDDATNSSKAPGKGLKRRDIGFLYIFIFSNIVFYIFLLYYAMLETLQTDELSTKLQIAIAVFFVLELDDWLYNVTIEPLKVLEDSVFELRIRGNKGSKKKRFRRISTLFWSLFFFVEIVVVVLFLTRSFGTIKA